MKRLIVMMILGLCLIGIVQAANPALPADLLLEARDGNAEAQVEMGILYEYGFRMKGNKVAALAWYLLAAEQGNARATKHRDKLVKQLKAVEVEAARKQSRGLAGAKSNSSQLGP